MRVVTSGTAWCPISHKNELKSWPFYPKFEDFYFLHQTLQLDKFEVADFKYDNNFSKMLRKTPKYNICP